MGAFVSPLYPSAGQDEGRRQAAEHPKSCTLGPHRKTPPTKLASRKPVNARQSGHPSIFSMPGMPIHHPWAGNAPFQCRELDARVVATLTPHMANEGQPPASGKSSAPSRGSATMPSKTGEGGISNASGAGVVVASLGRGFELVPG
ncbi:hypothetical protein PCL_02413 [Purpureocillium lilacinum]|uniref:Uncharacterized protein n=1 Tax=Purpureocillium lilacinum TaxID=33203 RepID=A0A2U3E0K1_PURLI|nr:hypothetical protein PCL_02413 [Purpureocillium lilacinum]